MTTEREELARAIASTEEPQRRMKWIDWTPNAQKSFLEQADRILASEWLRDLKATVYAEGAQDAAWNIEHEALIEYGVRDAIVNPYALRVFLLGDAQAEGPDDAFPPNPCLSGLLAHEHPKGDSNATR